MILRFIATLDLVYPGLIVRIAEILYFVDFSFCLSPLTSVDIEQTWFRPGHRAWLILRCLPLLVMVLVWGIHNMHGADAAGLVLGQIMMNF